MHRSKLRLLLLSQHFRRLSTTNTSKISTSSATHAANIPSTDRMPTSKHTQGKAFVTEDADLVLPDDITVEEIDSFPAFKTWTAALTKSLAAQSSPDHPYHDNPYKLRKVTIQAVDRFGGGRLGFIKLRADVSTDDKQKFPGSVFLRGGSVAMLLVLRPKGTESQNDEDEEFVILTSQPRIPAGTLTFTEIPAGMLDDSGTFSGAAAKEIQEETGLEINEDELIDMTALAANASAEDEKNAEGSRDEDVLQKAIYPSPGGSDEFIPLFLARKTMPRGEIEALQGKLTGLRDHGEKISLKIVKLRDVWKVAGRDAKTLSALYLYEALRGEGRLPS